MLNTQEFGDFLHSVGLKDFVGVPCSYLSPLINYAINENRFIMSNNEGDAVAIASGISLGGAAYGIVLMQNSGLSNALSPLTSLNHTFKIPVLCFVSLRGERDCNGKNTDEPQHELLGIITDKLLETCQVPYAFLDSDMDRAKSQVAEALAIMSRGESFFFIVREGIFSKVKLLDSKHLETKGNSSLGNHSQDLGSLEAVTTAKVAPTPKLPKNLQSNTAKQGEAAVSLVNTRIVYGEILDSKANSESTASDSKSISESTSPVIASERKLAKQSIKADSEKMDCHEATASRNDDRIESTPHTSLESPKASHPTDSINTQKSLPTRLNALEMIHTLALKHQALLLATTGKCGRELYEISDTPNQLYMVGSMGCVSALSLGLSLASKQKVIAIDGDSALLMRLGTLSTNAYYAKGNFCHILLDNESHDSTGGQFNLSPFVSFPSVARACGYTHVYEVGSVEELGLALKEFLCDSNSSLGNHSQDLGSLEAVTTAKVAPTTKLPKNLQSNTANTRIVCGEIQDSKANSESSLKDSHSILESTLSESHSTSESTPSVIASHSIARAKQSTNNINTIDCHDFANAKSRNDDSLESTASDSQIVLESYADFKPISESSLKDSCYVSESILDSHSHTNSNPISESTLSDSHSFSESKSHSYFIYLKIAKGSKENLGRPKITPQDVAKRLSAYMQEWRQNHAQAESSQNLTDTQDLQTLHNQQDSKEAAKKQDLQDSQNGERDLQNTAKNKACGNAQDSQTQHNHKQDSKEASKKQDSQVLQNGKRDSQTQSIHTSHIKEQK